MRVEFIEALHCPYSGTPFRRSHISRESGSEIEYGMIASEAGDFPIIDGILRLKIDEYRQPLIDLIRSKQLEQALMTASEPVGDRGSKTNFLDRTAHSQGWNSVARTLTGLKRPLYRILTDESLSLRGTATRLKSTSWENWHVYRFSMPAFLPVYALLHLIDTGPVLDFGCGVGHSSFLISRRVEPSSITCADYSFSLLYLAKKYFAREANFICLDGNYALPFASGYFSSVFSSDALHLIDSKVSLSREFQRILSAKGTIILPHLHNKLSPVRFGKSLTPEGYGALFGMQKRLMPEDSVVDQLVRNDTLDLERSCTTEELHGAAKGLSIVVSPNASVFRRHSGVWQGHIDKLRNPLLNPLYSVSGQARNWTLKKKDPDGKGKFSPFGEGYLPDTLNLSLPSLDQKALDKLKSSDMPSFARLAKQLVIVDVPDRF